MKLIIPVDITASELTSYDVAEENKLVPFDDKVVTQVSKVDSMNYVITPGAIVDGIAFLNVEGSSIDIVVTDPGEGVVYSTSIDLIITEDVVDGYTYCFNPVLVNKYVVKTDLPPYGSAAISITINGATVTDTAYVGEIVIGKIRELGTTRYEGSFEIIDYSIKEVNEFGDFYITERSFSKRIPLDVLIKNVYIGYLKQTLEDYRSTPVVCIPTEKDNLVGPFLIYGYYKTARVVVAYPDYSILTIEWEGLT